MIPYIHFPEARLGPLPLRPFGLLVTTGVLVGIWLAMKRAKERRLDTDKLASFITWMLVAGFLGGHMLLRIRDVESADPRYGALTPAQWACIALFVFGLVMVRKVMELRRSGTDPLELVHAREETAPPPDVAVEQVSTARASSR